MFEKFTLVKMKTDRKITSLSFGGDEFKPDENGVIEVPSSLIDTFQSHGFRLLSDEELDAEAKAIISKQPAKK